MSFRWVWSAAAVMMAVSSQWGLADPPVVAANRVLWLRADAGTNTTATGAAVTSWQDITNAKTFTGAANTSPAFLPNQANCALPALRFTGDRLMGNLGQGLTNATVFVLGRYNGPSPNNYVYTIGTTGNGSMMSLSRINGSTSYHFNGSTQLLGDPVPEGAWHVFSQVYRSTAAGAPFHTMYMDGANLNVAAAPTGYNVTATMNIGSYTSGGNNFNGDLAEVIVYDATLSDSDRQLVEAYLAARLATEPSPPQLVAHWRASAGMGKTQNGQPVTSWTSQTSAAQTLTNANATQQPVLADKILRCNHPGVRFDGNDQLIGNLGTSLTSATVFVIARYADPTSSNSYIYSIGSDGSAGDQMSLSRHSGTTSYHYNGASQFFGLPIPGQAWHVFSQVYHCNHDGSWHRLWVDGADRNISPTPVPYFVNSNIVLGNWSSGSFFFRGDIAEIRVYDRAMTADERAAVEAQLNAMLTPQADLSSNALVNVEDLLAVISAWGPCAGCPPVCYGDANRDCVVNVGDLLAVISAWGACP